MRTSLLARLATLVVLALVLAFPASDLRAAPHGGKPAPKATAAATAQAAPSASADEPEAQPKEPEPEFHPTIGPASVELGHDLVLALPEHYAFLAKAEATKLLERLGNFNNEAIVGLVVAHDGDAVGEWIATIEYEETGYVKDDETIDADALHKDIHEGTENSNTERVQRGFKAIHVADGWAEPPRYDKSVHHLVWALNVLSEGENESVNYNTRVLGRRGVVSLDLITAPDKLVRYKADAATLLGATTFKPGARYEDFNEKTDKVAEYGLIGLILGGAGLGAAKLVKVGLLAGAWKFIVSALVAGKKLILVAVAAIGGLWKRLTGGKKAEPQ
jgi:uncharacterized membrane-anchored protein